MIPILNDYQQRYARDRYIFIPGGEMRDVLAALGANMDDQSELRAAWDRLPSDPTLNYRQSRNGRFLIDYTDSSVSRLEQQGFRLSSEEGFVRHDSEVVRRFAPITSDLQHNSITQALFRFKAALIRDMKVRPRARLKDGDDRFVSTAFALRTITGDGLIGEPAAEGVHSDGVEHTLTTLINATNLTVGSAISTLHFNEEKTGISTNDADEKFVAGRVRHAIPFDTLVIVDTELKHSLTRVTQQSKESRATRDMLILFTRRPCAPEHGSFEYDSLQSSEEYSLKFRL